MNKPISVLAKYAIAGLAEVRTERKLRELLALAPGWYYGEGKAPSAQAVALANKLYLAAVAVGLGMTDVFPTESGDVLLAVYLDAGTLEFTVRTDGRIDVCCELQGQETVEIDDADLTAAKQVLRQHAPTPWSFSDSYPDVSMSETLTDLAARHSERTTEESPWSQYLVSQSTGHPSTNTYKDFTPLTPTRRLSFSAL